MRKFVGSANSYFFNDILIDAATGIDYQGIKPKLIIITHEHCDHFGGMNKVDCEDIAASSFCANVINEKKDEFGLCSYFKQDYPLKKIERILKEGDLIEGDGISLKVIETPGHAKGAICMYEEDKKILFSGDTVFPDMGMPRTDLPSSEPQMLKESYEKLAALDVLQIFPGHGSVIEDKDYIKKLNAMI